MSSISLNSTCYDLRFGPQMPKAPLFCCEVTTPDSVRSSGAPRSQLSDCQISSYLLPRGLADDVALNSRPLPLNPCQNPHVYTTNASNRR